MNTGKTKKLHQIYRRVPEANCKGLCANTCSHIGMSKGEAQNLTKLTGIAPALTSDFRCNYLVDERCSVYDQRPLICRLYGAVEDFKCEHGCGPEKFLPATEANAMIREVNKLGGGPMYNATERQVQDVLDRLRRKNGLL